MPQVSKQKIDTKFGDDDEDYGRFTTKKESTVKTVLYALKHGKIYFLKDSSEKCINYDSYFKVQQVNKSYLDTIKSKSEEFNGARREQLKQEEDYS